MPAWVESVGVLVTLARPGKQWPGNHAVRPAALWLRPFARLRTHHLVFGPNGDGINRYLNHFGLARDKIEHHLRAACTAEDWSAVLAALAAEDIRTG